MNEEQIEKLFNELWSRMCSGALIFKPMKKRAALTVLALAVPFWQSVPWMDCQAGFPIRPGVKYLTFHGFPCDKNLYVDSKFG